MIAFLGLGRMGAPLAGRLVDAGHDVIVWNRTPSRAEPLAGRGAKVAPTAADAVAGADTVITMLADGPALRAVADEIVPVLGRDTRWIDMSSVGPAVIADLAARVPSLVDAPVMGSVDRAASGELMVLAGGDTAPVADVLATFGTVVECGDVGAGAARKVLLISAAIGAVALTAELVSLGETLGVPEPLELLAKSPLAGAVPRIRATEADFPLRLAAKDVGIALEQGDLPILEAVRARLLGATDLEADLRETLG